MKPKKDEAIKARIDAPTKAALWKLAITRQLDMSDLIREALREFLLKQHARSTVN